MGGTLARKLGGRRLRVGGASAALATCLALFAAPGQGAFPGANGKIVFTSSREGNQEIYTMEPDGSGQTRLTNDPVIDSDPAWSGDGTRIVFEKHSGQNGLASNLVVMNADGTGQANVTPTGGFDTSPTWSPDGTKIAFLRQRETGSDVYVINGDGTGETRIFQGINNDVAWSPDGQRIAVSNYNGDLRSLDIVLINADGSGLTRLTNDEASDQSPTWSPDGTRIAFVSNRDDVSTYSIYAMNADGSGVTRLTTDSSQAPAWSPDGTKIVFSRASQLWVMNPDGTNQTQLITEGGFNPDWQRVEPPPPPTELPPPVLGESVNVSAVSGSVLVQTPGETGFTTLAQARQIKVGSRLDTKKGVVRLQSAADAAGATQSGDFGRGVFQVAQSKTAKGLTDLNLKGGNFGPCKKKSAKKGSAAAKKKPKKRKIRSLYSNAKGKFRTRGRYSAASVRGTSWLVTDRCDGTLTEVKSGTVSVLDFTRKKTIKVKAGKSYLARAKR